MDKKFFEDVNDGLLKIVEIAHWLLKWLSIEEGRMYQKEKIKLSQEEPKVINIEKT